MKLFLCMSSAISLAAALPQSSFSFGRYLGQAIDTSEKNSIRLVGMNQTTAVVDGFLYKGLFWRAEIPLDSIEKVIGQGYNFSSRGSNPFANHLQMRFSLKPGSFVTLDPQDLSDTPPTRITDFVFSVEAVGPVGVSWNFADGLMGNLASAHRLMALEDVVQEKIVRRGYTVHQVEIGPLATAQKRKLLVAALRKSDEAGLHEAYYLLGGFGPTRNCTSVSFRLLDEVVPPSTLGRHLWRFPMDAKLYLKVRGMLGRELPTLNAEAGALFGSTCTGLLGGNG